MELDKVHFNDQMLKQIEDSLFQANDFIQFYSQYLPEDYFEDDEDDLLLDKPLDSFASDLTFSSADRVHAFILALLPCLSPDKQSLADFLKDLQVHFSHLYFYSHYAYTLLSHMIPMHRQYSELQ